MTITFTVYGAAQAKGSMRAFTPRGMNHPVITDSNRSVKGWQNMIAAGAMHALDALPPEDRHLIAGGVRCEVTYYLPRPKALDAPRYRGVEVLHTKRPDVDKLTRAVLDALSHRLWNDDAQVVELIAVKRYAAVGAPARVDVAVMPSTLAPLPLDLPIFEIAEVPHVSTSD